MSSSTPTIRQVNYLAVIPQIAILCIFILLYKILGFAFYLGMGSINYLLLSYLLRFLVPIEHNKGIVLIQKQNFPDAILHFEKSFAFFQEKPWLDKYRWLAMLSSSKISYAEIALVNIAFCYTQMGEGNKGEQYYQKTLQLFPESQIAQSGLRMLQSVQKPTETTAGE
ncbi:MAG: tetratricopeptide repeat protein [Spirochaetota bacterium]